MLLPLAVALSSGLVSSVSAETILGVTVYSRHGDRSSKHYSGYRLTNLGLQQNFQVGSDYRDLYVSSDSPKQILGISEHKYVPSQISASAPDEYVLLNTATAFLQGLYPPLDTLDRSIASQTLNNAPYTRRDLKALDPSTRDSGPFWRTSMTSPRKICPTIIAFIIFDLINVGTVHNASMKDAVTSDQLFQLRTLADSAEFDATYNTSQPDRSIGAKTVNHAILSHLNETVASKGRVKFSLLAGSYDIMLAFFGLNELTAASPNLYGLPDYASTMAFEILTEEDVSEFPSNPDSLMVRFLFRNGSDAGAPLTPFPLFGGSDTTLSWSDFMVEMQSRAISTVADWCKTCSSTQEFCVAATRADSTSERVTETQSKGGMSNAVAGVIGALVTLGVVSIVAAVAFILLRNRTRAAPIAMGPSAVEKGSISGSVST